MKMVLSAVAVWPRYSGAGAGGRNFLADRRVETARVKNRCLPAIPMSKFGCEAAIPMRWSARLG